LESWSWGRKFNFWSVRYQVTTLSKFLCTHVPLPPTVAYLGGARCDVPPLWPDHENFLQVTLYEKVRFLPSSSKCQQKWLNLRLLLNVQMQKVFGFTGALPPNPPTRGSAPGAPPQTPVIGLRSVCLPWPPPLPNPKYATDRQAV